MSRFNRSLRKFGAAIAPRRNVWSFDARIARVNRQSETMSLDEILALNL